MFRISFALSRLHFRFYFVLTVFLSCLTFTSLYCLNTCLVLCALIVCTCCPSPSVSICSVRFPLSRFSLSCCVPFAVDCCREFPRFTKLCKGCFFFHLHVTLILLESVFGFLKYFVFRGIFLCTFVDDSCPVTRPSQLRLQSF